MSADRRQAWFTTLLEVGLKEEIFAPTDVLAHATPEVLSEHLPAALMSQVLQSALTAGAMTPESVLKVVSPDKLTEHVPHDVLWALVTTAVKRVAIPDANGEVGAGKLDGRRKFLCKAIDDGVSQDQVTAEDVINHLKPEALATYLPTDLKAKLITEALAADKMNPALIVEVVGVEALATHMPMSSLWAILNECGERALRAGGKVVSPVEAVTAKKPDRQPAKPANGARAKTKEPARVAVRAAAGAGFEEDKDTNVGDNASWAETHEEVELIEEADALSVDWQAEETTGVELPCGGRR